MLLFAAAAVWCTAAGVLAVALGRAVRVADRREHVPQLDVPLWRGTDLPDPDAWPLPLPHPLWTFPDRPEEHP